MGSGAGAWRVGLFWHVEWGCPENGGLRALCWPECNGALGFSLTRGSLEIHEGTTETFFEQSCIFEMHTYEE